MTPSKNDTNAKNAIILHVIPDTKSKAAMAPLQAASKTLLAVLKPKQKKIITRKN